MPALAKSDDSPCGARTATRFSPTGWGKNISKKAIDLALYLAACGLAGTGLLLAYRLPHRGGTATGMIFLGYGRHEWGEIHTWLAYVALLLGAIHLVLNRQWLMKVAASRHLWRLAAGILSGIIIVAAFLVLPVDRSERDLKQTPLHLRIGR